MPELGENEKFLLEARVGRMRAYASAQFSNKCMEYPCVPPERLEFRLDPHDPQNKMIEFTLKIFRVRQHTSTTGANNNNNAGQQALDDGTRDLELREVLMGGFEWAKLPICRNVLNFCQAKLQKQGVVAGTSRED